METFLSSGTTYVLHPNIIQDQISTIFGNTSFTKEEARENVKTNVKRIESQDRKYIDNEKLFLDYAKMIGVK